MVQFTSLAFGLALAAIVPQAFAIDKTVDPALDASLITTPMQLDRQKLLAGNSPWFFDFTTKAPFYNFDPKVGGGVTNANAATFPATVGNGMTLAMLNLAPCGMLPPHYHPRASNYVVAVRGNTTTFMYEENGAELVTETLLPGQMTIFPMGSMHMMVNNGCEPAQLVSALNNEDQGTNNVGNVFTAGFPIDLVNAAWGYQNIDGAKIAAGIPSPGTGANPGSKECLAQCGLLSGDAPNGTYSAPPSYSSA